MIVGAILALIYIVLTVGIMIFDMELIAQVPNEPDERVGFWIGAGGVLRAGDDRLRSGTDRRDLHAPRR